jgi:EPS-associated MarR family transcriptional regulator
LNEEIRFRLLRLLADAPEASQRELAHALGLSLGKTNHCLRELADAGWVAVAPLRRHDQRLRFAYALTDAGRRAHASATRDALARRQDDLARLAREIEELRREAERLAPAVEARERGAR